MSVVSCLSEQVCQGLGRIHVKFDPYQDPQESICWLNHFVESLAEAISMQQSNLNCLDDEPLFGLKGISGSCVRLVKPFFDP